MSVRLAYAAMIPGLGNKLLPVAFEVGKKEKGLPAKGEKAGSPKASMGIEAPLREE